MSKLWILQLFQIDVLYVVHLQYPPIFIYLKISYQVEKKLTQWGTIARFTAINLHAIYGKDNITPTLT